LHETEPKNAHSVQHYSEGHMKDTLVF